MRVTPTSARYSHSSRLNRRPLRPTMAISFPDHDNDPEAP